MSSGPFSKIFGGLFKGKPPEQDQKDDQDTEPEFEHSDSGYLDRTTADTDCFTFRINGLGLLRTPRGIIVHADKKALTVSAAIKTSRKPEKRVAMLNATMDDGTWRADAKRYDMTKLSTASFRIAQRPIRWPGGEDTAHVIVMDYGRRPIDLNYTDAGRTLFGHWNDEAALAIIERLRDAVAHVQGGSDSENNNPDKPEPKLPDSIKDTESKTRDDDPF